jgi:hypothetical protein
MGEHPNVQEFFGVQQIDLYCIHFQEGNQS